MDDNAPEEDPAMLDMPGGGERCDHCGRGDVDEHWLWFEVHRIDEDVDCEFEDVDLVFCSQAHASRFLAESEIEWHRVEGNDTSGVRVDRFFMGCGLLAIILSVVGLVALIRWIF